VMVGERGPRKAATAALFLGPSLIPLLLFTLGPMAGSLGLSFYRWNLPRAPKFIGLANFQNLMADPSFASAVQHTLFFIVGYLPLVYCGGLVLALALNQRLRGLAFFRAAYFLPVVTSWVVVALMWRWLLNPSTGIVNFALGLVGISGPGWWTDPTWAMPSIIVASAWKDLGYVMVILLAGLQAIPPDYYEAAAVDGANRWERFRNITLPLLSPASFFVLVISLINSFQVFDQVQVMTGGGPAGASNTVVQQIYVDGFRYSEMGYASAMSWLLFLVILGVTVVQFRLQTRWVNYA
jgi:multiple sugar transport system permease protein